MTTAQTPSAKKDHEMWLKASEQASTVSSKVVVVVKACTQFYSKIFPDFIGDAVVDIESK